MRFLVTFISPKRSAGTLQLAAEHARLMNAEIIVLKIVPDAHKVGVVAELIESDRPAQKAAEQVGEAARALHAQGIAARGVVRVDEVSEGIVRSALEWQANAVYVGTFATPENPSLMNDPIAHYVIRHCAADVILVRPTAESRSAAQPVIAQRPQPLPKNTNIFLASLIVLLLLAFAFRFANTQNPQTNDEQLTHMTSASLIDWHVSGLWVINSPVAWVRITNYNSVPIKEVTLSYTTYNAAGHPLDTGTYEIDGTVAPHTTRNFVELYLGLVSLESERLSIKLLSVKGR
jgi:nucleotide-binding universal stress UspA family protein